MAVFSVHFQLHLRHTGALSVCPGATRPLAPLDGSDPPPHGSKPCVLPLYESGVLHVFQNRISRRFLITTQFDTLRPCPLTARTFRRTPRLSICVTVLFRPSAVSSLVTVHNQFVLAQTITNFNLPLSHSAQVRPVRFRSPVEPYIW